MLQDSILFYKKLQRHLEEIDFKMSSYVPCVARRIINGKRHVIAWYLDDLGSSHENLKFNGSHQKWLEMKYGNDKLRKVQAIQGKVHNYLCMT
jgi:hypothetical protein